MGDWQIQRLAGTVLSEEQEGDPAWKVGRMSSTDSVVVLWTQQILYRAA